jgi:hypothetical protein
MGKMVFKSAYEKCLQQNRPYVIQLPRKIYCQACGNDRRCECSTDWVSHNLVEYFDIIKEETRDGQFIPDLLLANSKGEKVYIEIAVTHYSSERKIDSGTRIIEIALEQEEDLELIRKCHLRADDEKAKLINFSQPDPIQKSLLPEQCLVKTSCFHICTSGAAKFKNLTVLEHQNLVDEQKEYIIEVDKDFTPASFMNFLQQALSSGYHHIKDCCFCDNRYRKPARLNEHHQPFMFCSLKKTGVSSDTALECLYYKPHPHNLRKPDPEPIAPIKHQPATELVDSAPQEIHRVLVGYANGKENKHCFLCTKRDVSGYKSKPDILVFCRELGTFNSPEQASDCSLFDPYPRDEIARKLGQP